MGSTVSGFGNFYDLIALLDDPGRYDQKLRELDRRVDDVRNMNATAVERNREADAKHKLAEEMLEQVNQKLAVVNATRASNDKAAEDLASREKDLADANAKLAQSIADLEATKTRTAAAIAHREKAIAADEAKVKAAQEAVTILRKNTEVELKNKRADVDAEHESILAKVKKELEAAFAARKDAEATKALMESKRRDYEAFIAKI